MGSHDRVNIVEAIMFGMNQSLRLIGLGTVCWVLNDGRLTMALGKSTDNADV